MSNFEESRNRLPYASVWNDTVAVGHLAWAALICTSGTLATYVVGLRFFPLLVSTVDQQLLRGYSLGLAILVCLLLTTICAMLFPPKRDVEEAAAFDEDILSVLRDEGISREEESRLVQALPEAIKQELTSIGLYDKLKNPPSAKDESLPSDEDTTS